jgi:hypothetical protein
VQGLGPERQHVCDLLNLSHCCEHFPTLVASPTHLPVANIPHSRQQQLSPRCPIAAGASASAAPSVCRARDAPFTGPTLSRPSPSRPIPHRASPQSHAALWLHPKLCGASPAAPPYTSAVAATACTVPPEGGRQPLLSHPHDLNLLAIVVSHQVGRGRRRFYVFQVF